MAAQFTATNGFFARAEPACSELAASSLPVPDSPVISTVQRVSATFASIDSAGSSAASLPSIRGVLVTPRQRVGLGLVRRPGFQHRGDRLLQRAHLERLDQEVARAGVHRAHRVGDLGAAAHRDDGGSGRVHARGGEDLEAADVRHADVGQDQVEALFLEARVAADAVHRDNFMTGGAQDAAQAPAEGIFVVAEENLSHGPTRAAGLARFRAQVSHVFIRFRRQNLAVVDILKLRSAFSVKP